MTEKVPEYLVGVVSRAIGSFLLQEKGANCTLGEPDLWLTCRSLTEIDQVC
jgi:hypothetical protein